jgi:hypothetical protein
MRLFRKRGRDKRAEKKAQSEVLRPGPERGGFFLVDGKHHRLLTQQDYDRARSRAFYLRVRVLPSTGVLDSHRKEFKLGAGGISDSLEPGKSISGSIKERFFMRPTEVPLRVHFDSDGFPSHFHIGRADTPPRYQIAEGLPGHKKALTKRSETERVSDYEMQLLGIAIGRIRKGGAMIPDSPLDKEIVKLQGLMRSIRKRKKEGRSTMGKMRKLETSINRFTGMLSRNPVLEKERRWLDKLVPQRWGGNVVLFHSIPESKAEEANAKKQWFIVGFRGGERAFRAHIDSRIKEFMRKPAPSSPSQRPPGRSKPRSS